MNLDVDLTEIGSGLHAILRLDAGEETPRLALRYSLPGTAIVTAYDPVATMAARGGLPARSRSPSPASPR